MLRRKIAIADIHGCSRTFKRMLFERLHVAREDILYLLGDYIDRGPDSQGVLDTILALRDDGFDIRPLMGNHEAMLLQALEAVSGEHLHFWMDNGGRATLKSYGVQHPDELPSEHIRFMRSLPLHLHTATHIFVHAGLNFCLEEPFSHEGEQAMLWDRYQHSDRVKQQGKVLVVGHTVTNEEDIRRSLKSRVIRLDNGCYMGGRIAGLGCLAALELETGQLHLEGNCEGAY